jgi:hypothetical protein
MEYHESPIVVLLQIGLHAVEGGDIFCQYVLGHHVDLPSVSDNVNPMNSAGSQIIGQL